MPYSFLCYESPEGRCDVKDAYDACSESVQAQMDLALIYLGALRRDFWTNPRKHAARLDKQKWPDFYEIRFKHKNVQYRPIGFFANENEFVFVIWCIEQGNKIRPESWFKTANARRLEILSKTAKTLPLYDPEENS